ncbi:MAG: DUF433 domain-containing protein [Gemmatimonadales bacterium]
MRAVHQVVSRAPDVRRGTPVFAGTSIPVHLLIDHLDRGGTLEAFHERHRQLPVDLLAAACALGLEALIQAVPIEPLVPQGSLLPRIDAAGVVLNAEELRADQVVGRQVRCPACRGLVFKSWPEGWDGHAATRCRGLSGRQPGSRKAEFKRRFGHLFRS